MLKDRLLDPCSCTRDDIVTVRMIDLNLYTDNEFQYCNCPRSSSCLLKEGYFRCAPKKPKIAFPIRLLQLLHKQSVLGYVSRSAWSGGLRALFEHVGNASRALWRGAHTGATSTGATPTRATPTGATSSGAMAMARDPGHGDLAFLHSSVFHFLSSLLLHTSIYLTISRIAFISLLLFRDLSLVLSSLTPLALGLLLKTATAIRYLVIGYEPSAVTPTKNLYKTSRVTPPNRSLVSLLPTTHSFSRQT